MGPRLQTGRLRLAPIAAADTGTAVAWLSRPDVRRALADEALRTDAGARELIAEALAPATLVSLWLVQACDGRLVGIAGLKPPIAKATALRAIGWRSLELVLALDPEAWKGGLADEALAAIADHARGDPVTFALLFAARRTDARGHDLMARCGFEELGRIASNPDAIVVFERAL